MQVIAEYIEIRHPPILRLYIQGAPHRRMHVAVIQKYREILKAAAEKIGLQTPISHPIDLYVCFIDPSSPDLDNLLTALYQAVDGKTLRKPCLLDDDGLICKVEMMKIFGAKKK